MKRRLEDVFLVVALAVVLFIGWLQGVPMPSEGEDEE